MRSLSLVLPLLVVAAATADGGISRLRGPRDLEKDASPDDEAFHSQAEKAQEEAPIASAPEQISPTDTGHRFDKFSMYDDKDKPDMQSTDAYPMSTEVSTLLRYHSNCYSLMTEEDYRMKHHDVEKYIDAVGGYPPRPTSDPNDEYWEEFRFVCQVQVQRRNNELPKDSKIWYPPDLWQGLSPYDVAEKVHDEYPGDNQAKLLEWIIVNQGIQLDYDILPFRCRDDFIGTEVRLAALNTWAITTVAPINFSAKWHAGQIRPEEMAWKIHTGAVPKEHVPPDVYQMVVDMNLDSATSFTQYPEGCPLHPSWPAMHSAASSMSLWLAVVAELTDEQYCQVLRTDYAVSFARTVAGVHYTCDNYAGLNMGQEVIAYSLPDHLANEYGADAAKVRAKIEKYRFDWRNFSAEACAATLVQPLPTIPKPETTTAATVVETTPAVQVTETTTAVPVVNPGAGRRGCVLKTVDFNDQPRGKYVTNEWGAYGLTLSASGGEGNAPRIFDTGNPGQGVYEGDNDLGTPNKKCRGAGRGVGKGVGQGVGQGVGGEHPGVGVGVGGEPGAPGENCEFLGNVLIIQEAGNEDMSIPDDNMEGGEVTLQFQEGGQYVKEIGLLDVDYEAKLVVEFNHSSGIALRTMIIPLLGDNSYQIIDIDIESVRSMKLKLRRSGAISFVSFCPSS